jgi:flagellin-like hook-associated protein FlgL
VVFYPVDDRAESEDDRRAAGGAEDHGQRAAQRHHSQRGADREAHDRAPHLDIQRTFLEHRINSLESGTAALRETPAAVAALTTRIDKFEAALDAMQQIRLQLGSVENKLSSLAESQAKMERTVEKLTVSK